MNMNMNMLDDALDHVIVVLRAETIPSDSKCAIEFSLELWTFEFMNLWIFEWQSLSFERNKK